MSKKYSYRAFASANQINSIFKTTIPSKSNTNTSWLYGKYSDEGGFELTDESIHETASIFMKANVTASNINWLGDVSKVIIRRVNGTNYYIYIFIAACIGVFFFTKSILHFIENGKLLDLLQQVAPIICAIIIYIIELWAKIAFKDLSDNIITMLNKNDIETEKM